MNKEIAHVVDLLEQAQDILFITGAGISADSGLPTYRGVGGLYNDRITEDGIPIETALAGETLATRPELTWKYLAQIEKRCRGASFNRAHAVIAEMEKHFRRVWVLTQNIDGLHQQAGAVNVIDIHGNMYHLRCMACDFATNVEDFSRLEIPPHCPQCRAIMRPDVVFFGEVLPYEKIALLSDEVAKGFDLYFSIGTTSVFPYIRAPIEDAMRRGRPSVEINPGESEFSSIFSLRLALPAAEALGRIWDEYKRRKTITKDKI